MCALKQRGREQRGHPHSVISVSESWSSRRKNGCPSVTVRTRPPRRPEMQVPRPACFTLPIFPHDASRNQPLIGKSGCPLCGSALQRRSGATRGIQRRVSAPRAVGVTDWGRPGNSGGNSRLSAAMHWVCGVEVSTDMPRFAEADQQMWVSPLLVRDKTAGCCTGFCTALAKWSSVTRRECFAGSGTASARVSDQPPVTCSPSIGPR